MTVVVPKIEHNDIINATEPPTKTTIIGPRSIMEKRIEKKKVALTNLHNRIYANTTDH